MLSKVPMLTSSFLPSLRDMLTCSRVRMSSEFFSRKLVKSVKDNITECNGWLNKICPNVRTDQGIWVSPIYDCTFGIVHLVENTIRDDLGAD